MPSKRQLQASYEIEEQINTRILWKNFYPHIRNWGEICPFLSSHLDFFSENCGSVSDELGERFHQDIVAMEGRYEGKWSPSMVADYCYTLMRDSPNLTFSRQAKGARMH
jgi:hypothetical protein